MYNPAGPLVTCNVISTAWQLVLPDLNLCPAKNNDGLTISEKWKTLYYTLNSKQLDKVSLK